MCAAVTLNYSKARDSGWVVIAFGWGFGVLAGAYTAAPLSGGHLNPAVTIGIADRHRELGRRCPSTSLGQMVGAMLGAVLCWLLYLAQFKANAEEDKAQPTLGIFSTAPEIRNPVANLITEIIATDRPGAADPGLRPAPSRASASPAPPVLLVVLPGRRHRSVARRAHRLRHQPGP